MISSQLQLFAQKNSKTYNFKCFYCGDSRKNKLKARGYLYSIGDSFNYRCHNCGKSISFKNFLKDVDSRLFEQYILEKFKNNHKEIPKLIPTKSNIKKVEVKKKHLDLPRISDLNIEHPARRYLEDRRIPKAKFDTLYYSECFKRWTNTQKQTFSSLIQDEPRIVIPLIYNEEVFGFQGRSLSKNSKLKYITIILNNKIPKVYGLDTINWNENVYILEGPFDSMFVPNSIAMAGADVNIDDITQRQDIDFIFIYDNEKRKKEIVQRMEKVINQGHSIVIWPDDLKDKDVNDLILSGMCSFDIENIIKNNTFRGLQAKMKLLGWKRC